MRLRDRALFYRSLGQLLAAGVPVIRALTSCGHGELAAHIERGATLTEALQQPGTFPAADLRLLAIAEKSGQLDRTLTGLADFTEQLIQIRRTITSGLILPAIILTVAAFIVPLPTLLLGGSLTGYLVASVGFLVAIVLVVGLVFAIGRSLSPGARDSLLRGLPIIGRAWRDWDYWRIAGSMEMLLSAGLGVVEALRETASLCRRPKVATALRQTAQRCEQHGEPVSSGLAASGEFPSEMIALWATGEESGRLDAMLGRLADQLAERCQRRMQELAQWLPRVAYAVVSLYVISQIFRLAFGYVNLLESL